MNWTNILLVSTTTLFAIISAALHPIWLMIVTAILASASTGFVLWQSSFDPAGKENLHRAAAKELLWIREQLLLLIERCHFEASDIPQLQASLEGVTRELTGLYKFTPDTSPEAYTAASGALKKGEFTFSDGEIDAFLPPRLRKELGH